MAIDPTPAPEGGAPNKQGGTQDPDVGKTGERNSGRALVRKLARVEKELSDLRAADEQRKQEALSETEKIQANAKKTEAERDQLREQMRQDRIKHRFESAARDAGAVNPKAAYKLADLSGVDIDEAGEPVGLDEVLAAMKTDYGFMFSEAPPPAPPAPTPPGTIMPSGGNPPTGNPAGKPSAEQIRSMTSAEFAELSKGVESGKIKL